MKVADIGSFKFKLAAYFALLSLLPLAAAWWAFSAISERSVRSTADVRLESGLRASLAAYQDAIEGAQRRAEALAGDPTFQRGVRRRDEADLRAALRGHPNLRVVGPGLVRFGTTPARAATRTVSVVGTGGAAATIIASVPLDDDLLRRLRTRSGLGEDDSLVLVAGGRVVAGPRTVQGTTDVAAGDLHTVSIGDHRYRALAVQLEPQEAVLLAAVTPQSAVASAGNALQWRLLVGLLAGLLLIAAIAYLAGRSIVNSLGRLASAANALAAGRLDERVEVHGRDEFATLGRAFNDMADQLQQRLDDLEEERGRFRDATGRFGQALAVTLDTDQLLDVIVETAVEATRAEGGYLLVDGGSMVHVGDAHAGPAKLELPLQTSRWSFGTLVLLGSSFDADATRTAESLVEQAVVALDNARLHRVVERQALVDGLTGLANRRHLDQELASALARAERTGAPVALILADLDDFKQVNDQHGHACGDDVLQEFAKVLREVVREMDVPGRWGGEEFAVVVPETDAEGAAGVAERIRDALGSRTLLGPEGEPVRLTASFGVAAFPTARGRTDLLEAADEALYRAKREGKNRVVAASGINGRG